MVDLGLAKLALIGGVAMVVIGPERLPAAARVAGRLFGRAQTYLGKLKAEVNAQMQAETLKAEKESLLDTAEVIRSVADDMAEAEEDFSAAIAEANRSFVKINQDDIAINGEEIRQKQREFRQKKRRYVAGPPVWYQRSQARPVRRISAAVRRQRGSIALSSAHRFFA